MKRITTLIVSMLLIASSVWARTPEEAAAIASGFMSQKGTDASVVQRVQRAKSTGVAQSTVSLEYIQVTKANDNAVYVFNHTDGGFVLVSAIDNSREVLGYNDNGRFDKNNIPKNMQFWLQMYADELASVDKTATRSVSAKAATSTYTAVSPILDCRWGQNWPYNEMCPTIGSDHAVTGCVATAISQIMYEHKHPAKGTGSHSYTSETNNITSSVNFGSTTYDWNNMLPYYDWYYAENYTDAQVSAVATLLYHVGVSSNMDYGVDGSGAYSGEALYNMTEYFDYDKAINPMSKDVMPEADILTAISNDLQLGRPVYISGSTVNNEGHAFVCDGIRQDGYLHINWGWDGYSDGYFALSALNPEDQGTGGSSDDSAFTQLVVVYSNIKPDEGGAAVSYITCDSYTRTSGNTLTLGASNVNYRLTTLMNNGLVAADGSIYYDIYNSSNQLQHSLPVMEIGLAPNYYYTNALTLAETLPSSMANGEYQLEVCYHDANGNIFPIWVAGLGELPRVAFSVSGNTAYFGEEVELNEFTIRVKKGASCDMYTSDGLYLWWWVTNQDGQLANLTLNADGWYTTTITSTASSINCLAVNTDVVNNGWGGHQQTINYTDITGDICLEIGAPDENNYYDIYETSCEEEVIPEVSTVPTAEDLAEYEQDGYFVACINFQGEVCNDIVFAGSYNGWATDPASMVKFEALEGFDGWYVAVIPVTVNEEGVEVNDGKPVQLANNGSFSWDYQTGDVNSWELISGSVDIMSGYSGESNLTNWSSAEPVILKSLYFKNNNSPCGDIVTYDYTINLKAPDCGGYEPAIIGDFNNWVEGVAMAPIGNGWYQAVVNSMPGRRVNFRASTSADWSNAIQIYDSEYGAWLNIADYYLTEETTINLDYSAGKYTLCENDVPTPECYTLNVNVAEGGYVNISPEADCYEEGTQITLTAEANEGYQFSQWSDGNTDNPRLLTMTEDIYLTAEFTYTPSYTIRVKKDDVSDMDLSNGLYLWWWYNDQAGQLANMTLGDDGWYTTTITSTASSINCLAVNTNDWTGQQTIDYTNITGDVCLAIGAKDWIYNYNYNLYEIPCSPMEYTTEHDFEDTEANAQWRFVQNGQTNYWTIGSAAGSMDSGSNALYITSDGNNYTYNNNASSTSWAYIPVTVTAIDSITFYWKGEGESYCDDLQVYLFPKGCTPIAGSTYIPNSAIQLGEYLSGQTDWQYFSAIAGVDGEYNLCLRWYNDGSIGEMPIAVDNMAITTPLNTTEYPLTYVLNEDGTATVVKCATDYSGNVSIPTVVTYNGTTYTVTSISENAFKECGYLTSVTIPNSMTSIGRMAFAYCRSLESVTLSENISSIEDRTFYDCESLTSITIPNNVTYVGNYAFGYCYNLSAVAFGNNVTTIDSYAFADCSSLSSVTIPASVSYIGYSTFVSCNSLNSIVVESGNTAYDSRNNCNAIIETASNTLIAGCQSTIIPETVTTIGDKAFYGCEGLTTIAIPNSVTSIGYSAFAYCDNLSSVDLGDGITTIHGSAFEYCYAMTSVTIPASVTEIGSWAFYYCPTIVMEGTTPPTISSSTFKSEATIFVPCTALDTYLATSVWQDLNLQGSNYTVTLSATEGGYAQITASDCATNTVTIEAYPEERYVFTQWSDGNTDNPRILTLTEDIALTAEFTILTYPVTNLVVTTNCGKAYASWEGDAPYYELTMYSIDGTVVLYDLVPNHYKDGVSNSNPYEEGDYYCQVRPMYSNSEGDYAGEAVQAPFTISADNCVDIEIHDLSYTITDDTTVNLTWNSEAYVYHVQLYDYQNNLIADEYINTNSYSYTLPEMGRYSFYVLGYNEDQTQFSSWQNISFDIVYSNWEYDLNFTNGYVLGYGANNKEIHLFSQDGKTHLRLDLYSDYDNSILGTYIIQASYNPGDCSIEYSNISYNGITSDSFVSGVVTVMRDNEDNYVFSFDITDGTGKTYANICTISSELLTSYNNEDFSGIGVTALTAAEALELTQSLEHTDMTTIPYFVSGVISHMRNTPEEIVLYTRARFDISDDGTTNNQFYCYNTKWLNNSDFTTGHEIALGDNVVVYGNLQNYLGTTPEIKGYIYQHYPEGTDAPTPCYTLVVDATEGGHVNISPEADCYEEGTEVTLTAEAYEGYQFTQWSDGSTENPRVLTITEYTTLTAQFSRLTYPVSDLVITTDCGFAHVSWTSDAPYYEVSVFNSNGETVVYGIIDFNKNCSNVDPLDAGEYIWQVIPMYSTAEGDYAGDAVQQTFTISLEGCVDPEIYDLTYSTTNDSIVNVTWVSEAPLYRVWMYDNSGELLNSEFINTNHYCDTLTETGLYQFQIRSVDADTMYYTSPAYYLNIAITIPETPCYSLNVTANDGGYVLVSPEADCYDEGTEVALTAEAYDGYQFSQWSDGSTDNPRTIVMTEDLSLTAEFTSTSTEEYSFTIRVKKDENSTMDISNGLYIWWWTDDVYEYGLAGTTIDDEGWYTATIITTESTINCLAVNTDVTINDWVGSQQTVDYEGVVGDICLMIGDIDESDWNNKYSIYPTECVSTSECYTLIVTAEEGGYAYANPSYDCYDEGTEVAVTAVAHTGYKFVSWSDGDTSAQRIVVMTQDYELRAYFEVEEQPIVYYTLMVDATEGGSVDVSPQAEQYEAGTQVIVTATPNEGYEFVTWSDGNTSAQRTIVMDKNYSLTATFRSTTIPANNYTLTLTYDEGGTVGRAPEQDYYEENATVLIFANANEGYKFVRWSDGNTENVRSITITQDMVLHATFVEEQKEQFTLTLTAGEGGTVTKTPDQPSYEDGTSVVIAAIANDGYEFVTWSDGNTSAQRTIVMDKDYNLTATFRSTSIPTNNYTLTLTCNEGGTVGKNPNYEYYEENSTVTIFANANEGYKFVQWSDGNTENVRSITMTQDMVLHATFVEEQKEQFTLTLTAGEGGTVTKTPDQPSYAAGSVVTITAQANEGFEFVSWSDGDKNSVRDITMTQNVELHATFKRIASNYDITNLSVTSSNKRITAKWESIATRFEVVITDRNNEVEHSEKVDITDDSKVYKYTAKKLGTYTVTIKPLNASDQQIGIEDSKTVTLVMKYSLFISTENENAGTVNEEVNGDYVDGETVEIVATPKNGYRFKMWDDGDTNAKRTLVMNQDYYLTASFSRIPTYTLTISEGENGLASMAAGSYTYKENEEVTITPLPYDGYVFDHWVVNGIENTTETLTLVMTQDYSVYPVCVSKPIPTYTLTILPGEFGKANMEAGTYTYQEGEEVTLLPIADTDYLFDQWVVNDEVNTDSVLVLVMDKDYTVMPTFIPNQVGVENIYDGITILVEQWTITVEATQAQDIALYDLVGHLIEQQPHTRIASFTVPSAGLYLIRTSSGVKKVRVE